MKTLNDIRSTFLSYFDKQGHSVQASGPLVPRNDPTLMFANSGMVQFKNLFTGLETRDYNRATTAQKCVRAGGKHNDLDNVGYTARHHTFFEMLGNFSFGDYFKADAIAFAWELLTKDFNIDASRLLVTVYHTDEEAANIWKKVANLPDDRIIRIATDDNFWRMGPTGPCGPCTEIFYDHGDHIPGGPPGSPDEDGDRFIEIWNIVFMQNEQSADGTMRPLEMQSIDTGMGLERIGALMQGKHDNYDTDLFRSLIEASGDALNVDSFGDGNVHHRVIADHLRSTSFLIADGVMPASDGRGYVLRRIMRRAIRHAHLLGATDPLMHKLVPALVQQMGSAYPELARAQALITETLEQEETRFKTTLERGLRLLEDEVSTLPSGANLPGETAFKLYDTFGFPLDLTQDALREQGRGVDTDGFDIAMEAQKAKARAAWSGSGEAADATVWFDVADKQGTTDFLGYDAETAEGQITAVVLDGSIAEKASKGDSVQIALNQTPFYAESGGQVGDTGVIKTETGTINVTDTRKTAGVFSHIGQVSEGEVKPGQNAVLTVDNIRRTSIRANHSATHLLHEALRHALGDHVAQRGSLNAADRLRFDFSHTKALAPDELGQVERDVNAYIRQNSPVETRIMTPDDARALGAQALFGEKYGDEVRVVSMGHRDGSGKGTNKATYSLELCGGTHVRRTGDIGAFVLLGDSASSSGVRRIEALTGAEAMAWLRDKQIALANVADTLKAPVTEVPDRVRALMDERKTLSNQVAQLKQELAVGVDQTSDQSDGRHDFELNGAKIEVKFFKQFPSKQLRSAIDKLKENHTADAFIVVATDEGKTGISVGVKDGVSEKLDAVELLKPVVVAFGGRGGGGRKDLAQGGAPADLSDKSPQEIEMIVRKAILKG